MSTSPPPETRRRVDLVLNVAIFLGATVGAWCFLVGYGLLPNNNRGDDPHMFRPAIGVAAGVGYMTVPRDAPGVAAFLAQETLTLDVAPLLEGDYFMPAEGKFELDRVYLLTAVGWIWRVTGVRWSTVWILQSLFFGIVAVATYGIFRLGARPIVSLLGTTVALVSPPVLDILPAVRDFGKGPFVLLALLFCGLVVRGGLSVRQRLGACVGIGLVIGIGVGFRQDSIVCLPPVLACALLGPAAGRLGVRLGAVVLVIVAFLVPAWPVLQMNATSGGNNAFYLIQGFSEYSIRDLDLAPASYSAVPSQGDLNVHAAISSYADAEGFDLPDQMQKVWAALTVRALAVSLVAPWHPAVVAPPNMGRTELEMWGYGAEQVARHYVSTLLWTFPADVLTRAYGSVLRLVRGHVPQNTDGEPYQGFLDALAALRAPLLHGLYFAGPVLFALTFLLYASRYPWRAFLGISVVLFFLGYPSLSSQPRHVYHLVFASVWFPAYLLSLAVSCWRRRKASPTVTRVSLGRGLANVAGYAVVVSALLVLPLWGARMWQGKQVAALRERYAAAALAPLPTTAEPLPWGRTRYRPEAGALFDALHRPKTLADYLSGWQRPDIVAEYIVADIVCSEIDARVLIEYADKVVLMDFETARRFEGTSLPVRVKLFVPAFAFSVDQTASDGNRVSNFTGLSLDESVEVKGFYRVGNVDDFPILMTMWLPEDEGLFRGGHTLRWLPGDV